MLFQHSSKLPGNNVPYRTIKTLSETVEVILTAQVLNSSTNFLVSEPRYCGHDTTTR